MKFDSQKKKLELGDTLVPDLFILNNMKALAQESNFNKKSQHIKGARYIVTGDIVEFGHRNVGDKQLFGIIGKGKRQQAYAKVILNIVDTESSAVVYYVPPCIAKID